MILPFSSWVSFTQVIDDNTIIQRLHQRLNNIIDRQFDKYKTSKSFHASIQVVCDWWTAEGMISFVLVLLVCEYVWKCGRECACEDDGEEVCYFVFRLKNIIVNVD